MNIYLTRKQFLVVYIICLVLIALTIPGLALLYKNSRQQLIAVDEPGKPLITFNTGEVKSESTSSAELGSAPQSLEELQNKFNKEYQNKFTIVFFYDGYSDQQEALNHIKVMRETLSIVEPFASSPHIATKIFTTPEQKCQVIDKGAKKFLDCDRKLVESFNALGIEHFKLVVLSPQDFTPLAKPARGKNSALYIPTFQGNMTKQELNVWLGKIFSHELGHSLGLRDEYVRSFFKDSIPEESDGSGDAPKPFQPAKPNCAPDEETAKRWWGKYITSEATGSGTVGYHQGCSGTNAYYYPVQGTLMSDNPSSENYGEVSEEYLRASIDCFYANQKQVTYPAGKLGKINDCNAFRKEYPNFWNE